MFSSALQQLYMYMCIDDLIFYFFETILFSFHAYLGTYTLVKIFIYCTVHVAMPINSVHDVHVHVVRI